MRWDWLLLWVAALVLLTQIQICWTLAGEWEGPITIGAFLPMIVELILLFLLAAASLADEAAAENLDLLRYMTNKDAIFGAYTRWRLGGCC